MDFVRSLKAIAVATVTALTFAAPARAQTTELKVSHFLPPNHTIQKAMEAWAEQLEKESGGKLKLRIYPAGQLGGGPNRQFDAARNGITDIAFSLHGATPGRYATTELVSLPFVHPSAGANSAVTSKRLTELAPQYLAKEHEGLKILWMAVTPPLMFHSKSKIASVDDFKGVKVRYAGTQFKNLIDSLGAVPLAVPPQETQDALAKGIVDAATFPYEGAASFDIGTVAKNTLEPGVSSASFALVMNPAKYESLSPELKALIDKTTGPAAAEKFGKMWDEAEVSGKKNLQSKGVEITVMPPAELAKMKKTFAPQIDAAVADVEKKGKPGREFFDAYTK